MVQPLNRRSFIRSAFWRHILLPENEFRNYHPPAPSIPDSIGHHQEWLNACRTRGPTTCNFSYSGMLTEAVLLGNVSYRLGKKLVWEKARFGLSGPERGSPSRRGATVKRFRKF